MADPHRIEGSRLPRSCDEGLSAFVRRIVVIACVLSLVAAACGGGTESTPVTTSPPLPPPPPPSPAQVIDGSVYLRSDTIAYPPAFTPTTPLANAQVSLSGVSTTTAANGAFALQVNIAAINDFVPLTVSTPGQIPSVHPWRHAELGQPVAVGLYPEVAVTPRPAFAKGIILMDAGGWMPAWYQAGSAFSTIDRARDVAGANLAAYVDQFQVTDINLTSNAVTITPEVWNGYQMGTRQHYEELVGRARGRGMQFMMLLSLFPSGPAASVYSTLGTIPVSNIAFWDAYFGAWQARVLEKTAIARDLNIEYVTIGMNLGYLSRLEPARWRALVTAIRAQGYSGKLAYFGNAATTRGFYELADKSPEFLELFDLIGVGISNGIQASPGDILDKAQSRARMRTDLGTLLDRVRAKLGALPINIVVILSTPSVHGGVSTQEYIEPALGTSSIALQRTRDYQQQADLYQAAAEVINASPLGNGRVMGLLSWGYTWTNDLTFGNSLNTAAFDRSANVRGKPAEAVLKWWFERW